jgi:hypothetical protein
MTPIPGARIQSTNQEQFDASVRDASKLAFQLAQGVSEFFKSAVGQAGEKISSLAGPTQNVSNFTTTAAANPTPMVQAQQAQNPVDPHDYGPIHPNVRFAVGVDPKSKYQEVIDIGLPKGKNTTWEESKTAKPGRPNPSEYLDSNYIQEHLSLFDEGAITFVTTGSFDRFTMGFNNGVFHGRKEGLFVLPASIARKMIEEAKSDPSVPASPHVQPHDTTAAPDIALLSIIEKRMGMPKDSWAGNNNFKLHAVFIPKENLNSLKLRMVTGTEDGANNDWRPGGYTLGGIPEAFIDAIPMEQCRLIPYQGLEEVLRHGIDNSDVRV